MTTWHWTFQGLLNKKGSFWTAYWKRMNDPNKGHNVIGKYRFIYTIKRKLCSFFCSKGQKLSVLKDSLKFFFFLRTFRREVEKALSGSIEEGILLVQLCWNTSYIFCAIDEIYSKLWVFWLKSFRNKAARCYSARSGTNIYSSLSVVLLKLVCYG